MRLSVLSCLFVAVSAYQPSRNSQQRALFHHQAKAQLQQPHVQHCTTVAAVVALSTMLLTSEPVWASSTAAQISLNSLPPSSISVQIQDLPVVGNLLSGTYTKVPDGSIKNPSITVTSPPDKIKAISEIATSGHLEFDVSGGILNTHMDVDVAADEPGVAKVRVASGLIPQLPFKNLASSSAGSPTGGKPSPWNMVTNMGSGETYYYNEKSGVTQYERPEKF